MKYAPIVWLAFFSLAGLGISSCGGAPPVLVLDPEAAALRGPLERVLGADASWRELRVIDEGEIAGSPVLYRLTTAPDWALPADYPPAHPFPAAWGEGLRFDPPPTLSVIGLRPDGAWSAIPLLYDVLGASLPAPIASPSITIQELLEAAEPGRLLVAGDRPSARQAMYFLSFPDDFTTILDAPRWFNRTKVGLRPIEITRENAWRQDSWKLERSDLSYLQRDGAGYRIIESYRDQALGAATTARAFRPLRADLREGVSVYAGIVLFLEYRGDARGLGRATRFARFLVASDFAREAGISDRWMAVDRNAPELDATSELIRRELGTAGLFYPLTDRLPSPLPEDSLLTEIQLAVERAPKR